MKSQPNLQDSTASHGYSRERQVREIAARLGIADFIYVTPPVRKGGALREVSGDGLVIVGQRGAVLQVKAREPERGRADTIGRARSWIMKNAGKARRQGVGTRRELVRRKNEGEAVAVCPVRALELPPDSREHYQNIVSESPETWPIIVVLDHPKAEGTDLGFDEQVVWFTLSDWQQLHLRLRSTSALLKYVDRVLTGEVHVRLGNEAARYSAFREADERSIGEVGNTLPFLAHETEIDILGVDLFRDVLEKVWPNDGIVPWEIADDYRAIVEFLDEVPPTHQAHVGRWFLEKRRELAGGHVVRRQASFPASDNHFSRSTPLVFVPLR